MGRYYNGDITGKFWFGVQSSSPMEQFGAVELACRLEYLGCGCACDFDADEPDENAYCSDCWESYEQHLEEAKDANGDDELTETWMSCEDSGEWEFNREQFELNGVAFINQHQELFDKYINKITFNTDMEYDVEWADDDNRKYQALEHIDEDVILADLCMLKQIQKFFEENPDEDICGWNAEY